MNTLNLSKRLHTMVRYFCVAFACAWVASAGNFYNGGNYSVDRPIDAVSFVNAGRFAADTFDIFSTRNTLAYTNYGTIQASYGMDFLTVDSNGVRQPSATILNGDRAVIEGLGTSSLLFGYPEGQNYTFGDGGYLFLNATNIINRGRISVSFWGDLLAAGQQVDLTRSTLTTLNRETPESARFSFLDNNINVAYTPGGVQNLYWGYWNTDLNFGSFATPRIVRTTYPTATNAIVVTNILADIDISYLASIDRVPGDPTANPGNWTGDSITTAGVPPVPALAYIQTNQLTATNNRINAVFIINRNPNILASARVDGTRSLSVTLGHLNTNNTEGSVEFESLNILETFTTAPTNIYGWDQRTPSTAVPYNIRVTRNVGVSIPLSRADRSHIGNELDPLNPLSRSNLLSRYLNDSRSGANSLFTRDLFTTGYFGLLTNGVAYTNTVLNTNYVAYAFAITSLPSQIPNPNNGSFGRTLGINGGRFSFFQSQTPFASSTNLAGRVRVKADNLKLDDTRIRAHGIVNLQGKHVTSSANTSIAAPYANYDLGSTNGTLIYRGFNPIGQPNVTGIIRVFVTSWTNTAEFPDPAAAAATTDPTAGTGTGTPATLVGDTHFRVMIIDADIDPLRTTGELVGLKLRATNLTTVDPVLYEVPNVDAVPTTYPDGFSGASSISGTEQVAPVTENWINQGSFQLVGSIGVSSRTFPMLKTLSNTSDIIGDRVALGVEPGSPLSYITNTGSIISSGYLGLGASTLHHAGQFEAGNVADLTADSLVLAGTNSILAGGGLTITAKTLDASAGGLIATPNLMTLNVSDKFVAPAGKVLVLSAAGVKLGANASSNDLSGVSVSVNAGRFETAFVDWPGLNRGTEASGFVNNSAISALVLTVGEYGRAEVRASGSGDRALYTRRLELNGEFSQYINITNKTFDADGLASVLSIDSNTRLYYSIVSVNGIELSGPVLDGALGGRLRLVRIGGANGGPISMTVGDGYVVEASWAVRYSVSLDSDGDGLVNALDTTPFSGAVVTTKAIELQGKPYLEISWDAAANTDYQILAQEPAVGSAWTGLSRMANTSSTSKVLKFYDPLDQGTGAKAYRILYKP
jgi:hypothetical protein